MPDKRLETRKVSELLLDEENFRILPEDKVSSQQGLLSLMERDFDLTPIGQSMADNGYFLVEPLIGIPGPNKKVIIVEGNRRLACLRLLTDSEARNSSPNKKMWEELSSLAEQNGHDLTAVPVAIYGNREELTSVLGFRHIPGPRRWGPLSKARFINALVERMGKDADFALIARQVGSGRITIRNSYSAYRVYVQARDDFDIDVSKLDDNFGVWYTALNNSNIREYIGLRRDKNPAKLKRPISNKKAEALKEVIDYVHGFKGTTAVIADSRQIARLGEILAVAEGRSMLRKSRDLELAFRSIGGEERTILSNLQTASFYLDEALKSAHRHSSNVGVINLIRQCEQTVVRLLDSINRPPRSLLRDSPE
jgi:hypothetical protein